LVKKINPTTFSASQRSIEKFGWPDAIILILSFQYFAELVKQQQVEFHQTQIPELGEFFVHYKFEEEAWSR